MPVVAPDLATRTAQLIQAYHDLPPLDRSIVQLFSVIYEPINRTTFLLCWNHVAFDAAQNQGKKAKVKEDQSNKPLTAQTLKPLVDRLIQQELLVQPLGQGPQCQPLLVEIASRDAVKQGKFEVFAQAVTIHLPVGSRYKNGPRTFSTERQFLRELRIGIYRQDPTFIRQQINDYYQGYYPSTKTPLDQILLTICGNPFAPEWWRSLPVDLASLAIGALTGNSIERLTPLDDVLAFLQSEVNSGEAAKVVTQSATQSAAKGAAKGAAKVAKTTKAQSVPAQPTPLHPTLHFLLQGLWVEQLILRGDWSAAQQQLKQLSDSDDHPQVGVLWGWLEFLFGEAEAAIEEYAATLKTLRKATAQKKAYFQSMAGIFFILALLQSGTEEHLQEAIALTTLGKSAKNWLGSTYSILDALIRLQQGDRLQRPVFLQLANYVGEHSIEKLIHMLCLYWVEPQQAQQHLPKHLKVFYRDARSAGYDWLALEAAELLVRLQSPEQAELADSESADSESADSESADQEQSQQKSRQKSRQKSKSRSKSQYVKAAIELRQQHPQLRDLTPLADLIHMPAAWELSLKALTNLNQTASAKTVTKESQQRIAWFITLYGNSCNIQPREQTLSVKGGWSRGRNVALKRLKGAGELSYLTPQDQRVCTYLKSYYNWRGTEYSFDDRAIAALVGHPAVFWDDTAMTRIEVVKGEPELLVKKKKGDRLLLQLSPPLPLGKDILVQKESPTRLKVLEITAEHRRIAEILGPENSLEVPSVAEERVLAAIGAVAQLVTVQSDIGGGNTEVEAVEADPNPHVHLLPMGEGLKVAVLVRPFAQGGSYYRPGSGGETVIAEIGGKRLQTTRNLRQEKQLAKTAIAACPTLDRYEQSDGEWQIEEPQDCLELLLELQAIAETIVIEWPEGEKLRVTQPVSLQDFKLNIQRQNDWFATTGSLQLDQQEVLDMQKLLALLDQTSGRFLPLGDGQFLALTEAFRKRLDELRSFSERQGNSIRFHPLAAIAMEDWLDEVGDFKADKHWQAHIKRLKDVQNFEPELPSTLQAELRDYQREGFQWLARLAHWGVGACLADDMGLGKTLQALAVILTRAPQGATLIVAPTSVCLNWASEAQRFAPTLKVISFGDSPKQRQAVLDNLQPFDLLVCSYGLLQQEEVAAMLAKIQWQTIVLDEAQSIKNFATKRSQGAMNLQGGFKVLTTGTPIENHLGELWNLFRFINPGLLGSLDSFNQRFAYPIERDDDKLARQRLKSLIQPFILRRTKSQVLSELPARTEITLQVELSQQEMAFYEALRQEAIAKLAESDAVAGAKHLQVLAEIMRLRRACCNPQLVAPDLALPSAKLQLFGEVLAELLDNRHKALVFSQFVDHLHIIRDYLDQQKIRYQYLDGSTAMRDRQQRVKAFQSGEGDVFLISLKAGGTGLNLTAADYVIHMDPWWNPAVEDQASDRAHRIGQQRPVTIYRLVAKQTIEEKIVALHQQKRDLADSLLEGTEMSGKVSTEDLLQLIQSG